MDTMQDVTGYDMVDVSVVIPCLNEEQTIEGCILAALEGINQAGVKGEVIVSDNGSEDCSVVIAEAAGARVIHCASQGYGHALRAGFAAARGRWILMGDADQSYDFRELPRFKAEIDKGFDLVMGTRMKGRIEKGAMPWLHRMIGNPVLTAILRILFSVRISDAHCGLRAFTREAFCRMNLRTAGMELASEIVVKAARFRMAISEIPITLHVDARNRPPHLRSFRDGWRHLRYMLMMSPDWLFVLPGFLLLLCGVLLVGLLLPGAWQVRGVTLDVHAMLLGMAIILIGTYLLLLGAFVKAFTYSEGLDVLGGKFASLLTRVKLEHGLLLALAFTVSGVIGIAVFVAGWIRDGMGDLDVTTKIRPLILFVTCFLVGIQLFFGSFFLSMLGIHRDDYAGD